MTQSFIQCPKCGKQCRVSVQHAGKLVACPKCQTQFVVPSTPPPIQVVHSRPIETERDKLKSHDVTQSESEFKADSWMENPTFSLRSRKKKNWRFSTIIAFCMLGVTLLLPAAMGALFVVGSINTANKRAVEEENSIDWAFGSSIVVDDDGRIVGSKSKSQKQAEEAGTNLGILLGSLCCPIVPYGLIMLVLGTSYFAFRSAGN